MSDIAPPWFAIDRTRIFFDMHLPDWPEKGVATKFDPQKLAETFASTGADSVVFYAKCQYGNFYYRSSLGQLHSGLNGRDLFRDLVEEAHRLGLKVIAYYSASWDTRVAQRHPEWLTLDRFGKVSVGRWPTLCLNSPYRSLIYQHLAEIAQTTRADGIWLDMAIIGKDRCYCEFCSAEFRKRYNLSLPRSETEVGWPSFLEWRYETVEALFAEARNVIKQANPSIAFCNNYWGYPYMDWSMGSRAVGALRSVDYATGEGYSEWSGITSPSLFSKYLRDASGDRPFEVLLSRFHETWDFTVRPATQMAYEAYAAAANGATVTVDDEPYYDGTIEPEVYRLLQPIFHEIRSRRDLVTGTKPLRYAGIWYSQKSHDQYSPERNSEFIASFAGVYKALLEEHVPVGFVFDERRADTMLENYAVLLLANVVRLDADDIVLLTEFVSRGGGLVSFGAVGSLSTNSIQEALSNLLGLQIFGLSDYSLSFLRFPPSWSQRAPGVPLLINERISLVKATAGEAFGVVIDPICETNDKTYYHNNVPSPFRSNGFPAGVKHRLGAGQTIHFAGDLAKQFARSGSPSLRHLIVDAIRDVATCPVPFTVECPKTTEFLVHEDSIGRWICHFLSVHLQQPTWYDQLAVSTGRAIRTKEVYEEVLPFFNVSLRVQRRVRRATLYPGERSLTIQKENDGSSFIPIPKIEIWETVVLDLER
jgi:putative glycosyl hydrolase-like family 6 (GHL6) protein